MGLNIGPRLLIHRMLRSMEDVRLHIYREHYWKYYGHLGDKKTVQTDNVQL